MRILVVNCGSSSLKYQLIDLTADAVLCAGLVERIGSPAARLRQRSGGAADAASVLERDVDAPDHRAAIATMLAAIREAGLADALQAIDAVAHRVVHGGEHFTQPVHIDASVRATLRALAELAPLHNPANLSGIELCTELLAGVPQLAVFDTAFHQSMPPRAWRYALPEFLYREHAVRRYGFHGSSHAWVLRRVARHLDRAPTTLNLISLHLGNGASAAAIELGQCIDTSMGMTPLEGLVMGTRCGDLDPEIPLYIAAATGRDARATADLLNRESGLLGLCGSSDMREVLTRAERGEPSAALALEVYCYRLRKYIGAYLAALGGRLDALVFTAGIGENAPRVRSRACEGLEAFGIRLDARRNVAVQGDCAEIQADGAAVRVLVVRADEEREIAEQARTLLAGGNAGTPHALP